MNQYLIVIEKSETGYGAYVPDLPGCITVGDSVQEVKDNMQEALALHLEDLEEAHMPIPTNTAAATMVAAY